MISIILPIRNEFKFISKTLDSIINQNYPKDGFEIIIADGMSSDGTRKIIHNYQNIYPNIIIIDNPELAVPSGFNLALNESIGEVIIRIDGHSEVHKDYIKNCIKLINSVDADCVGGPTKHIAEGIFGRLINIAQSSRFGVGGVTFRKDAKIGEYVDTLAFGAYKRDVFEKIGGYDEELIRNQDDEFNFRLIQSGGKIWLDPLIKSAYYPRNNLKKLFIQYFQYGFYKVRVIQKRRSIASWRHLIPGVFVISLLVAVLIIRISHLPFYIIWGSYIATNFVATFMSLFNSVNSKPNQKINLSTSIHISHIFLPIVFFILHFSYGLGFIVGLIKLWNKWGDSEVKDYKFNSEIFTKNINKVVCIENSLS